MVAAKPVLVTNINKEEDLVAARQRARQLSALLGFNQQDQTRIATAVSEITRNAYQYAGAGRLEFSIDLLPSPQFLWIEVKDRGPGIPDLQTVLSGAYQSPTGMGIGLVGTSRLMEEFHIDSFPQHGTTVRFGKPIPVRAKRLGMADIGNFCAALAQHQIAGLGEELERQNRDLLQTLQTLRLRESELERRQQDLARLNLELAETNRGVVALYAELDEKATALRRADEMKSRFLSYVSHEFRTPVNSILALTRLLINREDGELTAEQEKQVFYIRTAAQQLGDIVNDLLDLAKVESGKTDVRLAQVDIGQFLGATRALMRPLANTDAVSLVFEDVAAPLYLETDESKLGQILRNLISNSIKFTPRGEVRVSARVSSAGDAVLFKVTDTGIGIAPEDQERIFHEFTQIENPIQTRIKGTGLGLPLSRRLATLLGGTLTVESTIGVGSTFTLTLPASPISQEEHSYPVADAVREAQTRSILIVDDEPASRYLVHRLFHGTCYHVIESAAQDAVERARFEAPALILLDLVMPQKSGFEVLDELKSDEATMHIPVVVHTSKALTEADLERLGNRVLAVLPKGEESRLGALAAMRETLGEPNLFRAEPGFLNYAK